MSMLFSPITTDYTFSKPDTVSSTFFGWYNTSVPYPSTIQHYFNEYVLADLLYSSGYLSQSQYESARHLWYYHIGVPAASLSPFTSLTLNTETFTTWQETDSVGIWIPPTDENPGYWEGYLDVGDDRVDCQASCNTGTNIRYPNDVFGPSYLDDFNKQRPLFKDFQHQLRFYNNVFLSERYQHYHIDTILYCLTNKQIDGMVGNVSAADFITNGITKAFGFQLQLEFLKAFAYPADTQSNILKQNIVTYYEDIGGWWGNRWRCGDYGTLIVEKLDNYIIVYFKTPILDSSLYIDPRSRLLSEYSHLFPLLSGGPIGGSLAYQSALNYFSNKELISSALVFTGQDIDSTAFRGMTLCRNTGQAATKYIPRKRHLSIRSLKTTQQESERSANLYISAAQFYPPESYLSSLPIFLFCEKVAESLPLFLEAQPKNTNIPLYVKGSPEETMDLYDSISLFSHDSTGVEDFTTFTEVDAGGIYTNEHSYSRIHATITDTNTARFYKDMSADYFNRQWRARFELYIQDEANTGLIFHPFVVSNDVATASSSWDASNTEALAVIYEYTASGAELRLKNYENGTTAAGSISISLQRRYYIDLYRYGNTVTLTVYSGSYGGTTVGTLSLTTTNTVHRYSMIGDVLDAGTGDTVTYILDNLYYTNVFKSNNITLFISGQGDSVLGRTLFIRGSGPSANSYIPLQVFGGDLAGSFWTEDNLPLYIHDDGLINLGRTLFIKNAESAVSYMPTYGMPLVINGIYSPAFANIPLYLHNAATTGTLPFFITGPEKKLVVGDGLNDNLSIYIYRPDETAVIPLVIYNNTPTTNSYIPFHINGILGNPNANIPLVMPDVVYENNSYLPLYVKGIVPITGNITLAMSDVVGPVTSNISLMIKHGGGLFNGYSPLYVFGANIIDNNIPLVISDVVGPVTDSNMLYTHGY